jgi:hypothetical protein
MIEQPHAALILWLVREGVATKWSDLYDIVIGGPRHHGGPSLHALHAKLKELQDADLIQVSPPILPG